MYLLILLSGSIVSSIASLRRKDRKDLQSLAFIFWGATVIFIIDKTYAHIMDNEPFIDTSPSALMLGFTLLTTGLILWLLLLVGGKIRNRPQTM